MPRGGARPGAGAKPGVVSEKLKKELLAAVEKVAKQRKITPNDVLAEILVKGTFKGEKVKVTDWTAAYKIYIDAFIVKSSHRTVEVDKHEHGIIILPEIKRPEDEIKGLKEDEIKKLKEDEYKRLKDEIKRPEDDEVAKA